MEIFRELVVISEISPFGILLLSLYLFYLGIIFEDKNKFIFPNILLFFLVNIYHLRISSIPIIFSMLIALFYLFIGLIWCIIKSIIYINENKAYFAEIAKKKDWEERESEINIFVKNNKSMLFAWLIYWPLSILNTLLSIIDILFDKIYMYYHSFKIEVLNAIVIFYVYLIDSEAIS